MTSPAIGLAPAGEDTPSPDWLYVRLKRPLDVTLAVLGLGACAPVLALAALLVKLTSRGPVLYSQVRLGLGGRPFRIYKLRTMYENAEAFTGPCWCARGDPRVTPLGRFLRWSHLDELPQLWNILRGDMSLVGPRPERPELIPPLEQAIPRYRERLRVRPGLTGLAQVQLPPDTDLNGVRLKLAYDLRYLECRGLGLDCRLVLATALALFGVPGRLTRRLLALPRGEVAKVRHRPDAKQTAVVLDLQTA